MSRAQATMAWRVRSKPPREGRDRGGGGGNPIFSTRGGAGGGRRRNANATRIRAIEPAVQVSKIDRKKERKKENFFISKGINVAMTDIHFNLLLLLLFLRCHTSMLALLLHRLSLIWVQASTCWVALWKGEATRSWRGPSR